MPVKKKPQSRVKRLLNMFNPKNPKGGMLLFVLIFALGGGGYYLYRSFALSYTQTYYWNSPSIKHQVGICSDNTPIDYSFARTFALDGTNKKVGAWESKVADKVDCPGPLNYYGYVWYGPYRTFTFASYNQISACFRYSYWTQAPHPDTTIIPRVRFDVTSNHGSSLGSNSVKHLNLTHPDVIKAGSSIPTHLVCVESDPVIDFIDYVEARVYLENQLQSSDGYNYYLDIIRTNLSEKY